MAYSKLTNNSNELCQARLDNGLNVVLKQDFSAETIAFLVLYKVGSRNERQYTGIAHLLEHMMFKGTENYHPKKDNGVAEIFGKSGGIFNAATSHDRTYYYELVSSDYLDTCFAIEADRMRNLLFKKSELSTEKIVVEDEFKRAQNSSSMRLHEELYAAAYKEHPYGHPIIGFIDDVLNTPVSALEEFYNQYYWPNNASLIIVGNFDRSRALQLAVNHFGKIPASPQLIPGVYTAEPTQMGSRGFELNGAERQEQLVIGYHIPDANHNDFAALVAASEILGNSQKPGTKLFKSLGERNLSTGAYAFAEHKVDPGLFQIWVPMSEKASAIQIEEKVENLIEGMARGIVDQEYLERVKQFNREATIIAKTNQRSYMEMLAIGESYGNCLWADELDKQLETITVEEIAQAVEKYLLPSNKIVGSYRPINKGSKFVSFAKQELKTIDETKIVCTKVNDSISSTSSSSTQLAERVKTTVLGNGLTVNTMALPGCGVVAIDGLIYAGDRRSTENPAAATFVAELIGKGSEKFDAMEISAIADQIATSINLSCRTHTTGFSGLVTSNNFNKFVELLRDCIVNPSFPENAIQSTKHFVSSYVHQVMSSTAQRAELGLLSKLYPEGHPNHPVHPDAIAIGANSIAKDEIIKFHNQFYGPDSTTISVVGDMSHEEMLAVMETSFELWQPRNLSRDLNIPSVETCDGETIRIDIPDKKTADILVGQVVNLRRTDKDYFAAVVGNAVLGNDPITSRLGKIVRVENGLTYGIGSFFRGCEDGYGTWTIKLTTSPEKVEKAERLAKDVLSDLLEKGISARELEDQKQYQVGALKYKLASASAYANALTTMDRAALSREQFDRSSDEIANLTVEDVNKALRKYLDLEKLVTVIAGTL